MNERERLIEWLNERCYDDLYSNEEIADYLLANGVSIPVRCKDCKHSMLWRTPANKVIGECYIRKMKSEDKQFCMVGADEFCSYGERKEK